MSVQRKAYVASVVATVIILAVIAWRVDIHKLIRAFAGIKWIWIAGVFLLNLINTWVEAYRWRLILSSTKKKVRTTNTFAAMLVGVVGNTVLPLRFGDGARAYFLAKREDIPATTSLATVMLDRLVDITFFLILVVLTSFVFDFPRFIDRASLIAGIGIAAALVAFLWLMLFKRRMENKFTGTIGARVMGYVHRFTLGLSSLKQRGVLLPAGVLSAFSWGLRVLMLDFVFEAFGFDLPRAAAAVVLIFTNLGIAAVGTPANLGGFELATLAALTLFGVDTERALSSAIVFHAVEVVPMVLLGLLVLWLNDISSREILEKKSLLD